MSSQYNDRVWSLQDMADHQRRIDKARRQARRVTYETGLLHGGLLVIGFQLVAVLVALAFGVGR